MERSEHAAIEDEQHRDRMQQRVVDGARLPLGGRRPCLLMQREHPVAQGRRKLVLRVGEDLQLARHRRRGYRAVHDWVHDWGQTPNVHPERWVHATA